MALAVVFFSCWAVASKASAKPLDLERMVLDQTLWETKVTDFAAKYRPHGFLFMTEAKKDLRAEGAGFTLFGMKVGETVVRSEEGKLSTIWISIYNRGDNGSLSAAGLQGMRDRMCALMNDQTGVQPRDISKKGAVRLDRQLWEWKNHYILLEQSLGSDGKRAEFLRIKMKAKGASSQGISRRSSLKGNVVHDRKSGDVCIEEIPMVDQGRKGYCAVASAARVYQYYGLELDQHELAQIAGAGSQTGTSMSSMVDSLKKITGHVHSKVLVLYEYPKGIASSTKDHDRAARSYEIGIKEYARDIKNYNKIAKKQGKTQFPDDAKRGLVSMQQFHRACDPEIYRSVMVKKSSYKRFLNKIESYIDQGVPVGWCLQLGMFKEPNLPQAFGGHMRLIIGYNKKTEELIYSDSWGMRHNKKRMKAADAFCMSNVLLALPPNQ